MCHKPVAEELGMRVGKSSHCRKPALALLETSKSLRGPSVKRVEITVLPKSGRLLLHQQHILQPATEQSVSS